MADDVVFGTPESARQLRMYELIRAEKLDSHNRYIQMMTLMITVVWGGFGLFATQLHPESDLSLFAISAAWAVANAFALYWLNLAACFRDDELGMDHRLRNIEATLGLSGVDHNLEPRPELHPLVKFFAIHARFPVGMVVIGFGGPVLWTTLLIATWLIHFEVV